MHPEPVVIVTGASDGLGAATARWLGKAGTGVVLVARRARLLEAVAGEVAAAGGTPHPITGDLADPGTCERIISETLERFGRVDGLVHNAGVVEPVGSVTAVDTDAWEYALAVNLTAPFRLTRAALPALREAGGRVVFVSTGAAYKIIEGWTAYCASKAGLTHFARVVAAEEPGITVVSLRPGVVDTAMQARIRELPAGVMVPERQDYFRGLKEKGELVPPAVPGRVLAWLALYAPNSLSGEFLEYDDPRISLPAEERFPEPRG